MVLGDADATCGETDYSNGDHKAKTIEFYQSGWRDQWLTWVNQVVPMFKDNQQVIMWEVANEPGNPYFGTRPLDSEWQAYFRGTSDTIRALDKNHLIGTGVNIASRVNGQANYTQIAALPNIDAISFHDYSYEYQNGASVASDFTIAQKVAAQVGKPLYAGEVGVLSGATCSDSPYKWLSFASRINYLKAKTDTYFANGIGGVAYWEYAPSRAHWVADCACEMYPGDAMIDAVKNYRLP